MVGRGLKLSIDAYDGRTCFTGSDWRGGGGAKLELRGEGGLLYIKVRGADYWTICRLKTARRCLLSDPGSCLACMF